MVWSWFNSDKKEGVVGVASLAEFIRRVAQLGMSCFFGCFRVKDSHIVPPSESKNALSSLFLSDDESVGKGEKSRNSLTGELDFRELKNEAEFLKACGTLPETPVEIRKGSQNWENISAENGEERSSQLNPKKHFDESPTPFKIGEDLSIEEGSLDETPSSCMTNGNNTRRGSVSSVLTSDMKNVTKSADTCDSERSSATSSVSPIVFVPKTERKNKSVRFECESNGFEFSTKSSSSERASEGSKPSPNPTPLKLTNEMQTPGTVFPADTTVGKPTRIRSQYVYTVQNPFENNSEWKDLKAEILDSDQQRESNKILENVSNGKEMKNEASLSVNKQDGNGLFGSDFGENLVYGRTPGDRPILGMVAAHWKDDESSHTSPTVWDGNGIPNSTTKYKEDQKVSWHATPFEERLEKALSERTFVSQRKSIHGTPPFEFDETEEECDTALSHLQPATNLKSVVSS